ncbi:MAG TPA: bifunctional precorrin-2 dehydrogenase/sirohydrochlorin ferrochelatase [Chloroflexota bacterium]
MTTHDGSHLGYYPAFLDLRGRKAVVVGGGAVAYRKIESLLAAGARVVAVSPKFDPGIEAMAEQGSVRLERREYRRGDLTGAVLAIAATSDRETNSAVREEATASNVLLNVVDSPSDSNFIVPSMVRRGELTVAISTGGLSPALAKRLRQRIEEIVAPEYGAFLEILGSLRARVRAELRDQGARERFWTDVVESDAFELFRVRGEEAARARIEEILSTQRTIE